MQVEIKSHTEEHVKVTILCKETTSQVVRLKSFIESFDEYIRGRCNDEEVRIELPEVLYFEAVDNRVFAYTKEAYVEIPQKLYELETILPTASFIRCSKSIIVNINKIISLRPELNRTILVALENKEKLHISRRYVKKFKEMLGI